MAACGYTVGQAERAPRGITRLYVNQAMDASTDVGLGATVTRVMRMRVNASSAATLVSLNQAEAVLEARIDRVSDVSLSTVPPGGQVAVNAYLATLTGSLRLVDGAGVVVWSVSNVSVEESYLAGVVSGRQALVESAVGITESNRRRALDRAAERLADELYLRLMEGF